MIFYVFLLCTFSTFLFHILFPTDVQNRRNGSKWAEVAMKLTCSIIRDIITAISQPNCNANAWHRIPLENSPPFEFTYDGATTSSATGQTGWQTIRALMEKVNSAYFFTFRPFWTSVDIAIRKAFTRFDIWSLALCLPTWNKECLYRKRSFF